MKKLVIIVSFIFLQINTAKAEDWIYTIGVNHNNTYSVGETIKQYLANPNDYAKVLEHNKISDESALRPGHRLKIPYQLLAIKPLTVILDSISGSVYKTTTQENIKEVALIGDTFNLGDRIETLEDSSAFLVFADGSTVQLKENTSVTFDLLNVYGEQGMVDSKLLLNKGRADVHANPDKRKNGIYRFEVKTPLAISAVRGTSYGISSDDKQTNVELFSGKNIVSSDTSINSSAIESMDKTITLEKGLGTVVRKDKMPIDPVVLLSMTDIDTTTIANHKRYIGWPAVNEAKAYYIEVADDAAFKNIIWMNKEGSNHLVPDFINEDKPYYLKVAAVDIDGIIGHPSTVVVNPQLYPKAPDTYLPAHAKLITDKNVDFNWQAEPNEMFLFQLARDKRFDQVLLEKQATGNMTMVDFDSVEKQGAKGSTYFWRITKKGEDANFGEFSLGSNFYWRPDLVVANHLDFDAINKNLLTSNIITFPPVAHVQGYRIQLFRNVSSTALSNKIWDKTFETNKLVIPKAYIGTLFYRIALIDDMGNQAPFSELKQIERPNTWFSALSQH